MKPGRAQPKDTKVETGTPEVGQMTTSNDNGRNKSDKKITLDVLPPGDFGEYLFVPALPMPSWHNVNQTTGHCQDESVLGKYLSTA